jgi:hypothetical protein
MGLTTVFINTETEEPHALTQAERESIDEGLSALAGTTPSEKQSVDFSDVLPGDTGIADYYVVSEWSLRVAVRALQHVASNSRCHQSRVVADEALKAVGMTMDMDTDEDGKPMPVVFSEQDRPDRLQWIANHFKMWGE